MSNAALNWAFGQRTGSPGERLVLLVLADAANKQGFAWPAQAAIATKAGLQPRHVRNALTGLRKRELITPLGYRWRRRLYHVNHTSKPMFEDDVVGTPVPQSGRHPSAGDDSRSRHPSARVTPALSDQIGGTPVPTKPHEPSRDIPEQHFDRPSTIPRVSTDGRTDGQGKKSDLPLSGRMLARWVERYVPRDRDRSPMLDEPVSSGGSFIGARKLIKQHGARRVLEVIREMSEERQLANGDYAVCWRPGIKAPANYLAWYLSDA